MHIGKTLMPVVGSWEGTHAKGSCEPGQAGRCSHKQRPLVQWISLSRQPAAGTFFARERGELRSPTAETEDKSGPPAPRQPPTENGIGTPWPSGKRHPLTP